jgi:AGZA family xanthine/uracil permease-like MFS transporter
MMENINEKVNASKVGKFFKLEERGTNITIEFRGAVATFLTMAYILAVNPRLLSNSGGTCKADDYGGNPYDPGYTACMEEVKRQMIVATAITSMFACLLMGLWANLPIALSCGMGMNAYFTYNIVGNRGEYDVSYEAALTAVLIEGIVFFILAITGARYWIIKTIFPDPVRHACPAAIGFFLAHLGLQTAEGIGLVVGDIATAVTLGGCAPEYRTPLVAYTDLCKEGILCIPSDNYTCDNLGGQMTSATVWIGIFGFLLMAILLSYKIHSSFIIGIGFITFVSWFRGTGVSYFPDDEGGDSRFEYFKQIASIESLDKVFAKYDFSGARGGDYTIGLITLLYVDFLDTSGTLLGMVSSMDLIDKETMDFPNSRAAFSVDALATMLGSLFGLSPITSYIESGAGIEIGSRTGLTNVFVAFFFFLSIFFAPILSSIPAWATGGSLIIVGAFMSRSLLKVKWENPAHAITAFITVIVMPLTYSIAYGLIAGIATWFVLKGVFVSMKLIFGIADPTAEDDKEELKGVEDELVLKKEVVDGNSDKGWSSDKEEA